jgi:hypothetical protein
MEGGKVESTDIYKDHNAGGVNFGNVEEEKEEVVEAETNEPCDNTCDPDEFCIKSTEGVSINGVGFSKGVYKIGQSVGIYTIDEGLKNSLIALDTASIRANPHSA